MQNETLFLIVTLAAAGLTGISLLTARRRVAPQRARAEVRSRRPGAKTRR